MPVGIILFVLWGTNQRNEPFRQRRHGIDDDLLNHAEAAQIHVPQAFDEIRRRCISGWARYGKPGSLIAAEFLITEN